ncbi:MAG TPA: glycoside hydrolase family 38 C-terminal domain-containing protein [Dehalococcoidia bacterium]|nr:glycoside hydrolase family 38 C-terminal domain-containing protein [Dehalococcoidia bacterium]
MPLPTMKSREKRRLMVISHTHWDREWYLPYQSFRLRLVGLMDMLLEIFESDPEYKHFMLDGHAIPIEDYLEVRPDRFDDIERAVQQGKLLIGPWYIIPDEALPGGEALVRNFLRGHRVAKLFGPVMKVGYIPDPFGQIAHMPAILRGFGIPYATMWRGADDSLKTTEFFWQSPDGSEVLTIHKPKGYGAGATLPSNTKALVARIQAIRDDLEPLATTPFVLVMNGSDHLPPQPELPALIRAANQELEGAALEHSSLPDVFAEIRRVIGDRAHEWPHHLGEFRSGQRAHLLPGVLSARMWIKQRNQQCEDLLAHWAEPFSTWADILKQEVGPEWKQPLPPTTAHMPFPTSEESIAALIDRAWKHLLENQPHDSICGCSVDSVHDEMRQRYDWITQIGEEIVRQSLRTIGALGPGHPLGTIAVFNPTPQPATGYVTATVPWDDARPVVALIAPDGSRVAARQVGATTHVALPEGAPAGFDRSRAEIGFVASAVPGYGYHIYTLETSDTPLPPEVPDGRAIENEHLFVEADAADGTLTVLDKLTGRKYAGLNRFVDGGDKGDEYNYCPPETDTIVDAPASPPKVRSERAAGASILTIEMTYALPASLAADRMARGSATASERIVTTVTLTDGVPRADVQAVVFNAAEDHRLRVHFPSGVRTAVSKADQHFGVIERPIALPDWDPETWMEQPLGTYPQKAFVSVDDSEFGLTIANRGLPEYEVLDEPGGATIALTLLRCVGWLSRADIATRRGGAGPQLRTPGAQLHGRNVLDYSIIPHAGSWVDAGAHVQAVQFLRPMRARYNRHGLGHIPAEDQLLLVDSPAFPVSAIKRAEDGDGVIVRVYNITAGEAEAHVRLKPLTGSAEIVNLNEEPEAGVPIVHGGVPVHARPNQIISIRFRR